MARVSRAPFPFRAFQGRRGSRLAVFAAVLTAVPLLTAMAPPVTGPAGGSGHLPKPQAQKPVPVHAVPRRAVKTPVMTPRRRLATVWPAAATAQVALRAAGASAAPATAAARQAALAAPGTLGVRAGGLPVWAGPAVAGGTPAGGDLSQVGVSMASQAAAAALGVRGVVFSVARAGGTNAAAQAHVSLSYAGFADAYGGDYASRLRLVELPACALRTPQVAACRRQAPLASADDVRTSQLGADVIIPAAAAAQAAAPLTAPAGSPAGVTPAVTGAAVVLAAATSPSGSGGDYSATPLSEAGTWSAGDPSGAFTYSYPITVPPVPGGLQPDVSLGYNSQAVDGLTSSTQDQASWIGDGWDYSPGYIERDYQPCSQNASPDNTGDLCWSSDDTTTLSLDGTDTTLVQDASTGAWHPEADNGEKVSYQTGTTNGTHDGDYWVITTTDGTEYYFGRNELPGYASGDTQTNSAWTVPVFATASGQPCYSATFASSYCAQAWRWNLDYVVDPHSDAIAYFYNTETNYYARDDGTTGTASYTQGGALASIEYGLRAGSVYGVTPAGEVTFTAGTSRTDVPADLTCASGASCDVQSPTFWSKYQLATIATEALKGSSLASVDSWALAQTYPSTGDPTTPASLWLSSVTRTGQDGTSVKLPPVTFAGAALPNRVETAADLDDGYSIITRFRLTSITNETGGVTTVNYSSADSAACTSGNFPAPDANTAYCYPDYWMPPGDSSPVLDWFNKYAVTEVSQEDTTGNALPVVTNYSYAGAAWHYDDDSLTRSKDRTWDQWRGFRTVTTETGASPDPVTQTQDTYFQGMNGDYQSGGGTSSVSLTSSQGGETVTDSDQYAGMDFDRITYDEVGGGLVSDTVTVPWTSAATATQSQPSPLPALTGYLTGTQETKAFTALAAGGYRESDTTYTHDSYGRITSESDVPDTSDASQDTCTTTSFASSTSAWLLDLPAEVQVVSVPCGTTPSLPADAVSDTLYFYDGSSTNGAAPSAGNATTTQKATSYSGSSPAYTTESSATYDEYGRALTSTDADNRTTTTVYTPAAGAEPVSVAVTDPAGLVTTTTYDPARDLPLTVTNPASQVTTETYDGLGRLTAVWLPPFTTGPANYTFSYSVSATAPSVVTTDTEEPAGNYLVSETLYDALGRVRETQDETADGSRDVTDTIYDSDGWKELVSNSYYTTGAPSGTLVAAEDSEVPSQTGYVYDGDGRVTRQVSYTFATPTWETDTAYGGNETTVSYQDESSTVPAGGTPETTFTDGRGLTAAVYQYHAGVPVDPSDPAADYDETSYTYTPAHQLATITDAAGNTWSYGYDLPGDQVSQSDPDAGASTSAYDAAGQLMSVTDARGKTVSYAYDADGRKTAEYDTTGGAAESSSDEVASWLYDTVQKGQLTSSTSYAGGNAYTEKVLSYNGYGLPAETETVIPSSAQAGALAGTYIQEDAYEATGQLKSYTDLPAGGLPDETVGYSYDNAGEPTGAGSGIGSYVSNLSYTELGQPLEYTSGTGSEPVWQLDSYDQETGRLTEAQTVTGTSAVTVDDMHYAYDDAGDVTSEADTPSGGTADVQCFQYDYLGRLTQAWAQGAAGCAASPSQSAEGGAAPYWDSYSYNSVGDLTSQTSTPVSGAATAVTSSYPAAGSAQPHAVTSQQSSGPAGTTATSYGYDADGNTTSVTGASSSQLLSWADDGQLSSDTTTGTGAGTTSYTYDAAGNLLLQSDPGTTTLYLPGEQIFLNTATGTLSGTRYYAIGGVTVAARTSATQFSYLVGDQQGTGSMAINSTTLAVTQRWLDPYGNPVGTPASSWPGTAGFVGGTADPATGLTDLGAREYNPAEGAFISPDPLLDPSDPQDLNPYAYASDNPSTDEDPSGQMLCNGDTCGSLQFFETHPSAGDGGSTTAAPARGATYPPVAQVSPHVYAAASDPQLPKLRQAWSWVVRNYGAPHSASAEFSDWWHACGVSPFRSACTGQFGADFNGMTPNYSIEGAFGASIKLILGGGGAISGYLMPLLGSYGSAKLGRALIATGDVRSPSFDAHHIVPENDPRAQDARDVLENFGIDINDADNGVFLPAGNATPNPGGAVPHRPYTMTDDYADYVNSQLANAGSEAEAREVLQFVKSDLLAGNMPWQSSEGADAGAPGE